MEIIHYGDPLLRAISEEVREDDCGPKLERLCEEMIEAMRLAKGIGLSGVQVGILKRIFVMEIPEVHTEAMIFLNPELVKFSRDFYTYEEGCLSIPDVMMEVKRPRSVVIQYRDLSWNLCVYEATELAATCLQHEVDHLNGKLFIDHIKGRRARRVLSEKMEEFGYSETYIRDEKFLSARG